MCDVLKPGETLIAKTKDYTAGTISRKTNGITDGYDLYLIQEKNSNYVLVIFMKIQFLFENTTKDKVKYSWTKFEQETFVSGFKLAVKSKWGNRRILKTLPDGSNIFIEIRFDTWIGGWTISEHWEVNVKKIKAGTFERSSVSRKNREAFFDSEDLGLRETETGVFQQAAVHEFGHMLGLPDEYIASSSHNKDFTSIMNAGGLVHTRHDSLHVAWLEKVLKENSIAF